MRASLIGPEGTGKSTLFTLLSGVKPQETMLTESFSPPTASVAVDDPRLDKLFTLPMFTPKHKLIPVTLTLYDFPGFSAATPARLVNRILPEIRQSDLLVAVFRARDAADAEGMPSQVRSFVEELVLLDLAIADGAKMNLRAKLKAKKNPEDDPQMKLLTGAVACLEAGKTLCGGLTPDERTELAGFGLLTAIPLLAVVNVSEELHRDEAARQKLHQAAEDCGLPCATLPVEIAAELEALPDEERAEFAELYGVTEPPAPRLRRELMWAMGRITFFTYNEKELRAWALPEGASALEAAAAVHTDLARGFIRAEVIGAEELLSLGSDKDARKAGRVRSEGKEYVVQDGDVVRILHSG
jgi:ribosome-binding ATPase YchF (GTP1/OBG family)